MLSDDQFEELVKVLLHPIPRQRREHSLIYDQLVQVGDTYFLDPEQVLASTARALHVLTDVLRHDGLVYVVNSNPAMRPLMAEAASACVNPNVWWLLDPWQPGAISNAKFLTRALFQDDHQPTAQRFRDAGLKMVNPWCPRPPVLSKPPPSLAPLDKWRLLSRPGAGRLLAKVVETETAAARLPLAGTSFANPRLARLRLVIVLDPSHDSGALKEADEANILTCATLNAHTNQVHRITYPIYGREAHPAFTRFLLDWLLKVANIRREAPPRPPKLSSSSTY